MKCLQLAQKFQHMKTIKIKIGGTTKYTRKHYTRTIKATLPEKWEEISRPMLLNIIAIRAIEFDLNKRNVEILKTMLNLPLHVFKSISPLDLVYLIQQIRWINNTDDFIEPFIKKFKHHGTWYHLPSQLLENVRAFEYNQADKYFLKYLMNKDQSDALRMVATLCRPRHWSEYDIKKRDDIRQPLISETDIHERAERLKGLDNRVILYVMLFYSTCKKKIHQMAAPIFEQNDNHGKTNNGYDFGWDGVFMSLAEGGAFGTLQQVHETKIHEVIIYLLKLKQDHEQRLAALEAQQKVS